MKTEPDWWLTDRHQTMLYAKLASYLTCPSDDPVGGKLADHVACNYFVGKALSEIFGIDDFEDGAGGYLLANKIAEFLKTDRRWTLLGSATEQAVLDDASQGATTGQPVIAVKEGKPGHVVLILPGVGRPSTTWKKTSGEPLTVPNSAAFSLDNIDGAYVFCRLSNGFSDPAGVLLYWRLKR